MGKHTKQHHAFRYEGRFLEFLGRDGGNSLEKGVKFLRLATRQGELTIKIPKFLRPTLAQTLQPGDWIQVLATRRWLWPAPSSKLPKFRLAPP